MPIQRILFMGNSFTTRNDLPGMVTGFAESQGMTIQHEVISAGGASLRRHFNAGATGRITERRWDFVVLQEQSTLPIKNRRRFHENVREYVSAIRDSGARMVLYMTWARKKEPENQKLLSDASNEIGEELEAVVVPAGIAWELMLASCDKPALHAEDGSHPSLAGTYLAAYTLYAALFGTEPKELNARLEGLTDEDQMLLQGFARAALNIANG